MEKDQEKNPINYHTPYRFYKSSSNSSNVIILPKKSKSEMKYMPNVQLIRDIEELTDHIKEIHRQFLINIKTGGPAVDTSAKLLKIFASYIDKDDIDYIKKQVYGDKEKKDGEREKLEIFKQKILENDLPLFIKQKAKTKYDWTNALWETFKKKIFDDFIHDYFISQYSFTLSYSLKDDKNNDSYNLKRLSKVNLPSSLLSQLEKEYIYPCERILPNNNTAWRWSSRDEYERLGISGRIMNEIKENTPRNADSTYPHYWLPLFINDTMRTLDIIQPLSEGGKFPIHGSNIHNLIALVPFDFETKRIQSEGNLISLVTNDSYLHQALKLIDKTLNDGMKKVFEKHYMTQFFEYEKI
jgi:hypothetical protein